MLLHGSYFSNYSYWLRDPIHSFASAHVVSHIVSQDILNADLGKYFQGIHIRSGLFFLWRAQGFVQCLKLKHASLISLYSFILCFHASFFLSSSHWLAINYESFKIFSTHNSSVSLISSFRFSQLVWSSSSYQPSSE